MKVNVRVIRQGRELASLEYPIPTDGNPVTAETWSNAVCEAAIACKSSAFINDVLLDDETVIEFSVKRKAVVPA